MPLTKQAIKKLAADRKRQAAHAKTRRAVLDAVKTMRKAPSAKALIAATKILDKAVKAHVIHSNKGSRLKSRLSKLLKK